MALFVRIARTCSQKQKLTLTNVFASIAQLVEQQPFKNGGIMKEYGPYTRKDGRQIVILYDGKKTTSRSYPRVLVSATDKTTEVHHKDENPRNNELSNLEILDKNTHRIEHTKGPSFIDVICQNCKITFPKLEKQVNSNYKRGISITCGRSCASALGGIASGKSRRV